MGNVLNAMPKSVQPKAKSALQQIWQAATCEDAGRAFDQFIVTYEAKRSESDPLPAHGPGIVNDVL